MTSLRHHRRGLSSFCGTCSLLTLHFFHCPLPDAVVILAAKQALPKFPCLDHFTNSSSFKQFANVLLQTYSFALVKLDP
jgi:hypothetical protein